MKCEHAPCTRSAELGFRFCRRHFEKPPPSKYLRRRMEQRQITEAEIEQTLASPEKLYQSKTHPDRTVILGRSIFGARLTLVVCTDHPEYVITVAE